MSVTNGWTGGQYSLFRTIFGLYLFVHFAQLVPWGGEIFSNRGALPDSSASPLIHLFPNVLAAWDSPGFVMTLLCIAAGLSLCLIVGWHDRIAAIGIWYVTACLFGRNPLIANPSLPYVGWMLLAHACLPAAPYGAYAARGRLDPGNSWRMPQRIFLAAWVIMALGYSYSGFTKLVSPSWVEGTALERVLSNPLARPGLVHDALLAVPSPLLRLATWFALALELGFAPLALFRPLRPWLWGAMLGMHISLLVVIDFADLSLGMVMLHLFTFDPAWVRSPGAAATEMIFYDGHCGLCHRAVRFVLAEDSSGDTFRFAPLNSESFRQCVPDSERTNLPDSIVLRTTAGALLTQSAAALHILRRLGGAWRILGWVAGWIPAVIRDSLYSSVARTRHRLFRVPPDTCPLIPASLRTRFETKPDPNRT